MKEFSRQFAKYFIELMLFKFYRNATFQESILPPF